MMRLTLGLGRQRSGIWLHLGVLSASVQIDARRHKIADCRGLTSSDGGDNVLFTQALKQVVDLLPLRQLDRALFHQTQFREGVLAEVLIGVLFNLEDALLPLDEGEL